MQTVVIIYSGAPIASVKPMPSADDLVAMLPDKQEYYQIAESDYKLYEFGKLLQTELHKLVTLPMGVCSHYAKRYRLTPNGYG